MGKPVADLAGRNPQEVIFLLYHGKEGTPDDVDKFFLDLKKRKTCSDAVIAAVENLPRSGHPMKLFSSALLILGMLESSGNYREDCLNLIAKLPHLVATVINYHAGWGKTPLPIPELGYMEDFVHMLCVPEKNVESLSAVFRLFNILHYDHGGGNLSTFVGKAVASGLEDLYGSIAAAMTALEGPRHGRANQDCLEFVEGILKELGAGATRKQVEECMRNKLARKELVFGFGHAVLRVEDPRATVFYRYAEEHYAGHPLVRIALLLRTEGPKVLAENPKISSPYPNVDAMSGVVLTAAGFAYPEYYTVLFGLARSVGIAIQIIYERLEARGGKGTPIVRPKYLYKSR